ncbi:MAG: L-2-hydroxycarboxylate dehydrogenase [Alphaproteobacteria bacterium]|nr:L-2-hydroxycarboxylate dehydrogenase [Alphaproteobacteria bacterium]
MPIVAEATRRIRAETIRAFMTEAFCACGLPDADAATCAGAMLDADLSGSDAHGLFRLAGYVRLLKRGQFNPRANLKVLERGPATALVDGDNGMGHLVMTYAANLAVEIARTSGVGWVGVRRSNHSGAGSTYAAIPLAHDMVGIYSAVSASNFMAPWGGAEPLLGTNPIAIAIPAGREAPIVLDIATSVVSNGAIQTHAREGKPLPVGWVISREDGEPITDGKRLAEGMFVPVGTYKGSGLAIVLGLLGGPLNRAAFGRDVKDTTAEQTRETNTGHFIVALDVTRFLPLDTFKAEIDRHVRDLSSSRKLPGVSEIRIPGQGRVLRRADREKNGVPLSETLLKQVDEMAKSLAIEPLTARA